MTANVGTDYGPASSLVERNGSSLRTDAGEKSVSPGTVPKQEARSGSGLASQPKRKLRVLVVEDDPADVELVVRALRSGGFEPESDTAQTAQEFTERIHKKSYDVVLADYNLPSWDGMETVEMLRRENADVPVVLVSGSLGEHKAVECIKQGAADYVLKDHLARLSESVRRSLRERELREEHRHSLEELARSNRDLEQFAYVASHDLQEPLRMVATYTQLLAERYQGKLDENADKYIHYAVEGALRMQTLVQDLLAFSRVGRHGTEFAVTECNPVVEAGLKNLHTTIEESNAQITCETLPAVMADGAQLVQVFQNRMGNALKILGEAAVSSYYRARLPTPGHRPGESCSAAALTFTPQHVERGLQPQPGCSATLCLLRQRPGSTAGHGVRARANHLHRRVH